MLLAVHPGHHLSCAVVGAKLNKGSVVQGCMLAVEGMPWGCVAGGDAVLEGRVGTSQGKDGQSGQPSALSRAEGQANPVLALEQ